MKIDLTRPIGPEPDPEVDPRRLFVHEPGWRVVQKVGSDREFCYVMAPGQDFYHRLGDGELYLYLGDERLCLACAARRGLIAHAPRPLGEPLFPADAPGVSPGSAYDVIEPDDRTGSTS